MIEYTDLSCVNQPLKSSDSVINAGLIVYRFAQIMQLPNKHSETYLLAQYCGFK